MSVYDMKNDTEEEEWVPSSVFVEQYGYKVNSIAVFASNDRKIGRTDRCVLEYGD